MDTAALVREIDELKAENRQLREHVQLLQALHFGTSSEKLTEEDKRQAGLFNEAEDGAFDQEIQAPVETREVRAHSRKARNGAGRKPISEDLPRELIEYDLEPEQKICACGREKVWIVRSLPGPLRSTLSLLRWFDWPARARCYEDTLPS